MGIPLFFSWTGYSGWLGSCLGRIAQASQCEAHQDRTRAVFAKR
jgi:hypothetical protein